MIFLNKAKSMIQASDMFCSKQFLRYKTKNQYHTITGGLVTLSVLITISISFATMILQTLARTNISFNTQTRKASDPPLTTIVTSQNSKFMFGIRVMPQNQRSGDTTNIFNLSDSKRYFDISFIQAKMESGAFSSYKPIPLQKCTKAHWSLMPTISRDYDRLQIDNWLCPPLNASFDLQGQYSSYLSKIGMISVTACNNYTNFNKVQSVCATPGEITQFFANYTNILFGYLFSNPVLNPSQTQYIDYYLQTLSQATFSQSIGSDNLIYFADYEISSDNSIWPFQSIASDIGIIMDGNMQTRPITKTPDTYTYLRMMLFKSTSSLSIDRSVQKMSSTFSYIGGFFGAIATALFILKIYTNQAFEVSIGKSLFVSKTQEKQKYFFKNFNIFKFLIMKGYQIAKEIKIPVFWQKGEFVNQYQQLIKNQLNVTFLLRRLINLERMMILVLNDHQISQLQLFKRISVENYKNVQERLGYNAEQQELDDRPEDNQTNDIILKRKFVEMENCSHLSSVREESICHPISTFKNNLIVQSISKDDRGEVDIPVTYSFQNKQNHSKNCPVNIEKQEKLNLKEEKQNLKTKKNLNSWIVTDLQDKDKVQMAEIIMDLDDQKFT